MALMKESYYGTRVNNPGVFYLIGNLSEIPYQIKKLSEGSHCGGYVDVTYMNCHGR